MPLKIPTPMSSNEVITVTLSGNEYNFSFQFNEKDERWRISIFKGDELVIAGIKILEDQSLLEDYELDNFSSGILRCWKNKATKDTVGRNNLGIGKEYELHYVGIDEIL